jgi:ATP-dependent protease ClpP protease subunit
MLLDPTAFQSHIRAQMPDVIANLRAKAAEHVTAPKREAGYTIHNAAGDEAVVRIYDEIWWLGVNAQDLTSDLDGITAPVIRVEINSPGGDVFDGIAIYNALRTHPSRIVTRVDGLAASIASVIAQAGDHRIMVDSSQMMIHNAWGMVVGNKSDHEEMASLLQQQDEVIAGIYAANSSQDAAHFLGLMNAETWLTAERAVAEGLADEVLIPERNEAPKDKLITKIASAVSAVDDAVTSAEQVGASRAEAGKTLTTVTLESLGGLRDSIARIDGLLNDGTPVEADELYDLIAESAKRQSAFAAAIPAHFLG